MENTLEGIKSRLGDTEEHKWSGRYNNGNHPMGTEKKKHKKHKFKKQDILFYFWYRRILFIYFFWLSYIFISF